MISPENHAKKCVFGVLMKIASMPMVYAKIKAEKRKMKNKGYGSVQRKPYTRKDSVIPAKKRKTSNFCARFPVSDDLTTSSLVLNNDECGEQ
jgi:hypothetical protein